MNHIVSIAKISILDQVSSFIVKKLCKHPTEEKIHNLSIAILTVPANLPLFMISLYALVRLIAVLPKAPFTVMFVIVIISAVAFVSGTFLCSSLETIVPILPSTVQTRVNSFFY